MGWQSFIAVIFQAGNTIILNPSGFFVYNGKPGAGNLVATITPTSGTDPFGNTYQADSTVYGPNGSYIEITSTGGLVGGPAVLFRPQNETQLTTLPQVVANISNAGTANEQEILIVTSGKAAGGDDMAVQLFSRSANSAVPAELIIEAGGTTLITLTKTLLSVAVPISATLGTVTSPTLITTDVWHVIPLDAGWSTQAGHPVPQCRLTISGDLQLTGYATHANFVGGTTVNSLNPLPAPFMPANEHYWRSGDAFRAGLDLLPSGVITAFPVAAGNTAIDLDGIVALI